MTYPVAPANVCAMDQCRRCQAYKDYLETLSLARTGRIAMLAAPDVRFRDPFHDVKGLDKFERVFRGLFDVVDDPRFTVTGMACSADLCFLHWRFTCRPRLSGRGHPWVVEAVTTLRFDGQGRITEVVDYWDAGRFVYERVRILGPIFRYFRKRRMRA